MHEVRVLISYSRVSAQKLIHFNLHKASLSRYNIDLRLCARDLENEMDWVVFVWEVFRGLSRFLGKQTARLY